MSRRIEHSATYTCSPAALHAALTDEAYWTARLAEVGGPKARLDAVTIANGGVEVALTQTIAAENLPGIVSKLKPGDLEIARTETWGPLASDAATGAMTADVRGTPATVRGTSSLTGDDAGTVVRTTGDVEVKVPLVGGKIEQAVADNVLTLLAAEQRFTSTWLDQHR